MNILCAAMFSATHLLNSSCPNFELIIDQPGRYKFKFKDIKNEVCVGATVSRPTKQTSVKIDANKWLEACDIYEQFNPYNVFDQRCLKFHTGPIAVKCHGTKK